MASIRAMANRCPVTRISAAPVGTAILSKMSRVIAIRREVERDLFAPHGWSGVNFVGKARAKCSENHIREDVMRAVTAGLSILLASVVHEAAAAIRAMIAAEGFAMVEVEFSARTPSGHLRHPR